MSCAGTIAVVDRDVAVRDSFRCLLQAEGFAVTTFANIDGFLGSSSKPVADCLLLELSTKGDRHGMAAERICSLDHRIPIIVMVYHQFTLSPAVARLPCVSAVLERPIDDSTLLIEIEKATTVAKAVEAGLRQRRNV